MALPPLGATRRLAAAVLGFAKISFTLAHFHHNAAVQNRDAIAHLSTTSSDGDDHHGDAPSRWLMSLTRVDGGVVLGSSALVASSQSRILGSDASPRAMAMRCFWPPES